MKRYQAILILTAAMLMSVYVGVLLAENNVIHTDLHGQYGLCLALNDIQK
jgi:hypothetical protein